MERQQALEIGRDVIYREADLLDRWEWQAWSELYTEACEFWCPAWLTEVKLGEDPTQTLSHFYITSRSSSDHPLSPGGDRKIRTLNSLPGGHR